MSERDPESALDVIWKMGRDTLAQRDFMAGRGWVMGPMPFEAEVRSLLAEPAGVRLAPAACGCSCRCHADESKPDWPGPCAACCEPGMNCDHGRALARLAPAAAVDVEALAARLREADEFVSQVHDLRDWVSDEHRPAFDAAVWSVHNVLRVDLAALPPAPVLPHPGEPHEFRAICQRCGASGMVHISIVGPDEQVRVEPLREQEAGRE